MKPALVFDFGGVLIDWDRRHLYKKIFKNDPDGLDYFLANICSSKWNLQMDRGYPFARAVEELVEQHPEYEEEIRAFDTRWEEMIRGPIQGTVAILQALKETAYPLYGLSNWSVEKFRVAYPRYEFFAWFDQVLLSGEVKLLKPDPRIFQAFLERSGLTAEDCILIDDSLPNVEAAGQMGFRTIRFLSPEKLRADLAKNGIRVRA